MMDLKTITASIRMSRPWVDRALENATWRGKDRDPVPRDALLAALLNWEHAWTAHSWGRRVSTLAVRITWSDAIYVSVLDQTGPEDRYRTVWYPETWVPDEKLRYQAVEMLARLLEPHEIDELVRALLREAYIRRELDRQGHDAAE